MSPSARFLSCVPSGAPAVARSGRADAETGRPRHPWQVGRPASTTFPRWRTPYRPRRTPYRPRPSRRAVRGTGRARPGRGAAHGGVPRDRRAVLAPVGRSGIPPGTAGCPGAPRRARCPLHRPVRRRSTAQFAGRPAAGPLRDRPSGPWRVRPDRAPAQRVRAARPRRRHVGGFTVYSDDRDPVHHGRRLRRTSLLDDRSDQAAGNPGAAIAVCNAEPPFGSTRGAPSTAAGRGDGAPRAFQARERAGVTATRGSRADVPPRPGGARSPATRGASGRSRRRRGGPGGPGPWTR